MSTPSTLREAAQESPRVKAGVLFVDLDLTLLKDDIACHASDEELINAPLNEEVVAMIENARACGIPVVMATRNDQAQINRVFDLRPDIRAFFDDALPCVSGCKSDLMGAWLKSHNIPPEAAIFLDDTIGERSSVQDKLKGIRVGEPEEAAGVQVQKAEGISLESRQRTIDALKALTHANQVLLAA